ncbi:hypothetical protein KKH3_15470 [Pectobacterium actinidiae]|nr:hypothetical protein KKH3_15470 [Pectobacterium actinidiae]
MNVNRAMMTYGDITKKSFELGNSVCNSNEALFSESDGERY